MENNQTISLKFRRKYMAHIIWFLVNVHFFHLAIHFLALINSLHAFDHFILVSK